MTSIEENAKKIETLTRVARLLGDQLREQNRKIELLQEELIRIKNDFSRKKPLGLESISPVKEETYSSASIPTSSTDQKEKDQPLEAEKVTKPLLKARSSEKEKLKQALNVIDNL